MKTIFQKIKESQERNEHMVLVTVVASSGATPRGAGARMLVGAGGRICGTIGGGAVEYRAECIAKEVLQDKKSRQHNFSLTKDDVQNLGMICGGDVEVYFSYLAAEDENVKLVTKNALEGMERGEAIWLITDLAKEGAMSLYTKGAGVSGMPVEEWVMGRLSRRPEHIRKEETDLFVEQINSSGKVYVFGGGHVAQKLVPVLAGIGFCCVVLENREEFAKRELFPDASQIMLVDFEKINEAIAITEDDYACVMTRGHASDTIVQAQLLRTNACYIGVIGSAHKKAGVYQKLYEMGFTKADTDRITSPIGLPILAETPEEIAISIAGQMIEHRAKRSRG